MKYLGGLVLRSRLLLEVCTGPAPDGGGLSGAEPAPKPFGLKSLGPGVGANLTLTWGVYRG